METINNNLENLSESTIIKIIEICYNYYNFFYAVSFKFNQTL